MRPGHVARQPEHAHARKPGREVGIAIVGRDDVATAYLHRFLPAPHLDRRDASRARAQEADDALRIRLDVAGMRGHAGRVQVGRRGIHAQRQLADASRDQRRHRDLSAAQHRVHVVPDHIDDAVADAHVELDLRMTRMELRQRRHQDQAREGRRHIDPQPAARRRGGAGQRRVRVVQVGQHAHHALVVRGAVRRHAHLPRRAVQQLHPQAGLELLHQLRHGGLAQVQRLRRLGEAAGLHHAGEGEQRIESVHRRVTLIAVGEIGRILFRGRLAPARPRR